MMRAKEALMVPDVKPLGVNWIQTASGLAFDFDDIEANEIRIEDVAHALSYVNRFTGHVKEGGYNVAQHSVLVSVLVEELAHDAGSKDPRALALRGLLHDASEAYLGDVSRPLKVMLPQYVELEKRVEQLIERTFGLVGDPLGLVKRADDILLATEARDLMAPFARSWKLREEPRQEMIFPWPPKASKRRFLMRFAELTKGTIAHEAEIEKAVELLRSLSNAGQEEVLDRLRNLRNGPVFRASKEK